MHVTSRCPRRLRHLHHVANKARSSSRCTESRKPFSKTPDECSDMPEPPSADPSQQSDAPPEGSQTDPPSSPAPKQEDDHIVQQDFAVRNVSRKPSTSGLSHTSAASREGTPPPLPPRPNLGLLESRPSTSHSARPNRPSLVSKPTTQLSFADSANHQNLSRPPSPLRAPKPRSYFGLNLGSSKNTSDAEDSASIRSVLPAIDVALEAESMLAEGMGDHEKPLLSSLGHHGQDAESMLAPDPAFEQAFETEFDEVGDVAQDGSDEGQRHMFHAFSPMALR